MSRIVFREITLSDQNDLLTIYSDKEAMQYRRNKPLENIEEAIAFIDKVRLDREKHLSVRYGIVEKSSNSLIGTAVYSFIDDKTVEIGVSIGRAYWGKGFGQETVSELIELIRKEQPHITTLLGIAHKENIKSINMLKQLGFEFIEENNDKLHYTYLLER
ncbi:GNAT family N-acetyltransferase [Myroides injenensis]|uniref:GNAT family N-acetyltransferase n=1 Tax=Myroides injenensis TaxID=1183151 RepID=UPI002271D3AD|nr:GNAT family N-acetyltransferase [Myroides injenensis]